MGVKGCPNTVMASHADQGPRRIYICDDYLRRVAGGVHTQLDTHVQRSGATQSWVSSYSLLRKPNPPTPALLNAREISAQRPRSPSGWLSSRIKVLLIGGRHFMLPALTNSHWRHFGTAYNSAARGQPKAPPAHPNTCFNMIICTYGRGFAAHWAEGPNRALVGMARRRGPRRIEVRQRAPLSSPSSRPSACCGA